MATKLREVRESKGMTQSELSKLSGVHRVNISKYEAGKSMFTLPVAERLAAALGVTVDELIRKGEG